MTINWGIIGAGGIAGRFAESLAHEGDCKLVAISGRREGKLHAFTEMHEFAADAHIYADDAASGSGSGAADLLADARVDAVYLALPHGMHEEWAVRVLEAGKAVLCEKPAVLSRAQAERIARVSRETGILFMEAMKCRFVPVHERVRAIVDSGELGAVASVSATQNVDYGYDRGGYLVDREQGGALYDLGCYCASWLEEFLPGAIEPVDATVRWREMTPAAGEPYRIDWAEDARLKMGGKPAHLACDGAAPFESLVTITCEHGRIEVERLHRPERARVIRGDGSAEVIDAPYVVDDFFGEISHFCGLLRQGLTESPVMPLAATVRNAEIIDAVRGALN